MTSTELLLQRHSGELADLSAEFLEYALSSHTDRPRLERAIKETYRQRKLREPSQIIWMDSPLDAMVAANVLCGSRMRSLYEWWGGANDDYGTGVRVSAIDPSLTVAPLRAIAASLDDAITSELTTIDPGLARRYQRSRPRHLSSFDVDLAMGRCLKAEVPAAFSTALRSVSRIGSRNAAHQWMSKVLLTYHSPVRDSISLMRYRAYEIIGLLLPRNMNNDPFGPFMEALKSGGWRWPFEDICLVCESPVILSVDQRTRPHNETGPAISFGENRWQLWAINGVIVPEKIVRRDYSLNDIEVETNVEIRRVMIEAYGLARYMADSGAIEVHRDEYGILYRKWFHLAEAIQIVEVINATPEPDGSFKRYCLRVPPTMNTAKEAVAWTFGLDASNYDLTDES